MTDMTWPQDSWPDTDDLDEAGDLDHANIEPEPEPEPEFCQRLRALADFLATRPLLARKAEHANAFATMYLFATSPAQFGALCRALGSGEKSTDTNYINLTREVAGFRLQVYAMHAGICEKVQTGTRTVIKDVYPAHVEPAHIEVVEPVYEWICPDSFLSLGLGTEVADA